MTNQGARQQSVRDVTGTALDYNGDWHALFDLAGIPAGDFNGRLLAWINGRLGVTYTEINGAMNAFAESQGFPSWSAMGTFDAAGGFTGILDELTTPAVAAWSVSRALTTDWLEQPLIRLRRASDNVESDFGADEDGNLDTAAIATWIGGSSAFVVTVYDQVGSANFTQATAALQLPYVGSVAELDGRPAAAMGADYMSAALSKSDAPIGVYGVFNEQEPVGTNFPRFLTTSADINQILWLRFNNNRGYFTGSFKSVYPNAVSLPQPFYFATECDGVNNTVYYRGQAQTPVAETANFSFTYMRVGANGAGSDFGAGHFAEVLYFAAPLSGPDRARVFASHVDQYGIPPL